MYSSYGHFHSGMQEAFLKACQVVESDANYQPTITNKELLNLVVDEDGNSKYTPRRNATAIQPMNNDLPNQIKEVGKFYQIKIAKKGYIDGLDSDPTWHIDDSAVICVKKTGERCIYSREDVLRGDLTSPVKHLSVDSFLGNPSLHPKVNEYEQFVDLGLI